MTEPIDHRKIPEAVPPLPLPEFEYGDLEKGERIGTGGDADVYRATINHEGYTYPVAVKEPRFEGTLHREVVSRFENEAETWSNLDDHENIVSVYGAGTEPLPWIGLEYMDGGTLKEKVGSFSVAEALWISGRVAEGVRYGHRHGVAHLDIKPTNVLLRNTDKRKWDYPKVSDWGLAKMLLEHSNSVEGISPQYAAPEQFDAEEHGKPDDITDIYQLGALVYALLAGEPPFTGTSTAVMQGVLKGEPEPPSQINPKVPKEADEVVLKALEKRKEDRHDGVLTFRKEMDRLFEEYIEGDADATDSSAMSPAGRKDETAEREPNSREDTTVDEARTSDTGSQTQSSPVGGHGERPSSRSSRQRGTEDEDTSLVSRRSALGLLGVGVLGGGGWMITQMGSEDESSSPTPDSTDTPAEAPSGTSTGESTETETSSDTDTPADNISNGTIEYTWEDGRKGEWEATGSMYDGYVARFNINNENPISGNYSAQTEALNNRIGVNNPNLPDKIGDRSVSSVEVQLRLDGDINANGKNHNAFVLKNKDEDQLGRIVFYHGGTEIRWNIGSNPARNSSPRVLQSFSSGEVYNILIEANEQSFTLDINGNRYTNLPTRSDRPAEIGQIHIDSRNSTGAGSSLYDSPIYFTWDNIIIELA